MEEKTDIPVSASLHLLNTIGTQLQVQPNSLEPITLSELENNYHIIGAAFISKDVVYNSILPHYPAGSSEMEIMPGSVLGGKGTDSKKFALASPPCNN
jgi:hypothetical protein